MKLADGFWSITAYNAKGFYEAPDTDHGKWSSMASGPSLRPRQAANESRHSFFLISAYPGGLLDILNQTQ